jgi:hypothetical protein
MSLHRGQFGLLLVPPALDNEDFRAAWAEWLADRAERRLPRYTSRAQDMQFARLTELGSTAAIAAIKWSISQGYRGIWPAPEQGRPSPSTPRESAFSLEKQIQALSSEARDLRFPGGCAYPVELSGTKLARYETIQRQLATLRRRLEGLRNA